MTHVNIVFSAPIGDPCRANGIAVRGTPRANWDLHAAPHLSWLRARVPSSPSQHGTGQLLILRFQTAGRPWKPLKSAISRAPGQGPHLHVLEVGSGDQPRSLSRTKKRTLDTSSERRRRLPQRVSCSHTLGACAAQSCAAAASRSGGLRLIVDHGRFGRGTYGGRQSHQRFHPTITIPQLGTTHISLSNPLATLKRPTNSAGDLPRC